MAPSDAAIVVAALAIGALFASSAAAVATRGARSYGTALYGASAALCAILGLAGLCALVGDGPPGALRLPLGVPWIGAHLRLDALSGFFLLVLGVGGSAASVFAIGYGRHEAEPHRVRPFYPGFLGAMALVLLADDAFSFLVAWEAMSLLSWAMVVFRHREAASREAGRIYLAMAAFGAMALILVFGLLAGADGGYAFADIRARSGSGALGEGAAMAALALALLGAGSKAGLAPLHVWLPLAHPAAPSHVSALMSGVMTKVAIYGFIRIVFDLIGPLPDWASLAVIASGATTSVVGVMFALVATDLKRILACSTIENIGVIFVALGLALAFRADGMALAAALAFGAGLFHIFNHMLFKSLLFVSAGAAIAAAGRSDLDALGGLIRRMPATAAFALTGVVAIAALPPLNGFASEWLLLQAVLQGPDLSRPFLQLAAPAAGATLALSAALAAACFARYYGVGFLGQPRSPEAAAAVETDRVSLAAMALLAGLCVIAGVAPGPALDLLGPAISTVIDAQLPAQSGRPWLTLSPVSQARGGYGPLLTLVFLLVSGFASAWLVRRIAVKAVRRAAAWDCGFPRDDPMAQYTAGGFAQPLRRVLGTSLLQARETVETPPPGDMSPARHGLRMTDFAWTWLVSPAAEAVGAAADRLERLQALTIRRHLAVVFATLIALLTGLALWS